jgi:hypothetical protein
MHLCLAQYTALSVGLLSVDFHRHEINQVCTAGGINQWLTVLEFGNDPVSAAGVERLKDLARDDFTYERTWILLNKILPEFVKS